MPGGLRLGQQSGEVVGARGTRIRAADGIDLYREPNMA